MSTLSAKASMRTTAVPGPAARPRAAATSRFNVVAAAVPSLKLLPAKQTTAQQMACVSVEPTTGYTVWRPSEIAFDKNELVVGSDPRAGSLVDVLVAINTVSRNHAQLVFDGSRVIVIDLGSTNGTFVEGQRITKGERVTLGVGQTVSFDIEKGISYTLTEATGAEKAKAALAGSAPAWTSEGDMGDRVKDRAVWIQNWRKGSSPPSSLAWTSEAEMGDRVKDRALWIQNWRKGSSGAAAAASAGTSDDGESWWKAGLDDVARANLLGSGGAQVVRRKVQRPQLEAVLTPELEADRVGRGGVRVERRNTGKRPYTGYVADLNMLNFAQKWAAAQQVSAWHKVWAHAAMQSAYADRWAVAAFESEASRKWATAKLEAIYAMKWAGIEDVPPAPVAVAAVAAAPKEETKAAAAGGGGFFSNIAAALFGGKK